MKYKVMALDTYQRLSVADKVIGNILPKDYVFEVSEERLKVLLGDNSYNTAFVKLVDEEPKKKSRKKSA